MTQDIARPTRTQAQRSAHTRQKLLDATIESLVELGYAGTSTQGIARRAGVSRGAQLHQFPTKVSLVVAAVEYLVEKRLAEILATNPAPERGLEVLVEAFTGPLFYASLELWVAARTDRDLFEAMVPLERRVTDALMVGSIEVMGERFGPDAIELSIEMARGFAVSALFRTSSEEAGRRMRLLPVWEEMVTSR